VSSDRIQQLQALYNDAAALEPQERAAFLDGACRGDSALRKEIESLLAYEHQAETWLDRTAFQVTAQSLADDGAGALVDRKLGRYQILSLVGRGGMGDVYCAVDSRLNRLVAVKTLPSYMSGDQQRVERFEQEARAIAALNHPHICILHDAGCDDGLHYLVFEYVVGEPLSDRLSHEAPSLIQGMEYATQIAEALDYAHDLGVIHLDLKPSNIMMMRSGVKLLDFGVAELRDPGTLVAEDVLETKSGTRGKTAGTLGYMAPEQLEGAKTDARTDIFAFGAVLYEIFTQRRAFPHHPKTALALGDGPPAQISNSRPEVPASLDSLVARCLALKPSERWQSMAEVSTECRAILAAFRES
jgi:eukaryotic-like serine/threonine-protein kinase